MKHFRGHDLKNIGANDTSTCAILYHPVSAMLFHSLYLGNKGILYRLGF